MLMQSIKTYITLPSSIHWINFAQNSAHFGLGISIMCAYVHVILEFPTSFLKISDHDPLCELLAIATTNVDSQVKRTRFRYWKSIFKPGGFHIWLEAHPVNFNSTSCALKYGKKHELEVLTEISVEKLLLLQRILL